MSIKDEIAAWNEKSAEDIKAIYNTYSDQPDFSDTLIRLLEYVTYQKGASWLLKAQLEGGNHLNNRQAANVCRLLAKLEHWETKLHLLQCLAHISVAKTQRKSVETFLRTTLADTNKFVRAWSYNGFYELALQHPEYQHEAQQLLDMAMRDEAASVKARVRNILKKGF